MRLIDADALIRRTVAERDSVEIKTGCDIGYHNGLNMAVSMAINAPTIDAVEVVHGRWEDKPTGRYGQQQSWCSVCRKPSGIGGIEKNRHRAYCPNCGARMDGDGNA